MQEPICFRPGTSLSLLYLVFTNEANMIDHIDYLPGLENSNYVCICFHLSCYSTIKPTLDTLELVLTTCMQYCMHTINWLNIMEPMDTQEAWEFFKTVFQDIVDKIKYAPITTEIQKKRDICMCSEASRIKKLKKKLWKSYCIMGNFWINIFSKNNSCQRFWNNIFERQGRDLVSSHYNSVVSKIYFQNHHDSWIFLNKTIWKVCIIQ